ncbi:hypothetical protein LWI29_005751 [Acer saccharum]|uniref:Uncharacterized protein n=1 Tax=Acer saccharum TaxID=4024 RepID=A0AA39RYJ0_ACESA|nr:hypothetical protein LWI29_005751 [Acer saccharum]
MVVTLQVANCIVTRVMIDIGISVDILLKNAYDRFNLATSALKSCPSPLYGFTGDSVVSTGKITLSVTIGKDPDQVNTMLVFLVVNAQSAYNVILGRPFLTKIKGVISIYHHMLKFLVEERSPTPLALTNGSSRPAFQQLLVPSTVVLSSFASRRHRSRFHVGCTAAVSSNHHVPPLIKSFVTFCTVSVRKAATRSSPFTVLRRRDRG